MAEPVGATPVPAGNDEDRVPRHRLGWVLLALPAIFFLWLTLTHVYHRPLWRDEAATLEFASLDVKGLAHAVSHIDLVLAPYYALMHLVVLASHGALAIRLPSVVAGVIGVFFIGMAVRERWGSLAGFVAASFLATNAYYYDTSTTARPYALSAAALAVAAWLGAKRHPTRRTMIGWIVACCCAALMQPLSVLAIPCLALALVRGRGVKPALLTALVPCVFGAALVLVTRTQSSQVGWIKKLSFGTAFQQAERAVMVRSWLPIVLLVVAALVIQLVRSRRISLDWLSWLAAFVLPPLVLWVATEVAVPLFVMRYAVMFLPALAGLIGASAGIVLEAIRGRIPVRAVVAVAMACVCAWMTMTDLRHLVRLHSSLDGTENVARYLHHHSRPGDKVVYVASRAAGGRIYGWARYEQDEALEHDLLAQLTQGRGAELQVREVVSTTPYRTKQSGDLGARTWLVGPTVSRWNSAAPGLKECRRVTTANVGGGTSILELSCPTH